MKLALLILLSLAVPLLSFPQTAQDTLEVYSDRTPAADEADGDADLSLADAGEIIGGGSVVDGQFLETVALYPNYPNPFVGETEISFDLPYTMPVTVTVYDILGQPVAILTDGMARAGHNVVEFDATALTAGAYFYTMTAPGYEETRKMLLLK